LSPWLDAVPSDVTAALDHRSLCMCEAGLLLPYGIDAVGDPGQNMSGSLNVPILAEKGLPSCMMPCEIASHRLGRI